MGESVDNATGNKKNLINIYNLIEICEIFLFPPIITYESDENA